MKDTSLILRKPIPEPFQQIIREIQKVCVELQIESFLVGAFVRDLIFENAYEVNIARATDDIDFGFAVESNTQFEELKQACFATGKFVGLDKIWQRIYWHEGEWKTGIDLIPFGGIESPPGVVSIEKGGFELSTVGFQQVFEDCWTVSLPDEIKIKIASPRGIALLKFVAYNDRPNARKHDLLDIYFIALNYEKIGNEVRIWNSDNDIVNETDFEYETIGARLLGRDLAALLEESTVDVVMQTLLEPEDGGKIEEFAAVVRSDASFGVERREYILRILRELRKGIEERIDIR